MFLCLRSRMLEPGLSSLHVLTWTIVSVDSQFFLLLLLFPISWHCEDFLDSLSVVMLSYKDSSLLAQVQAAILRELKWE